MLPHEASLFSCYTPHPWPSQEYCFSNAPSPPLPYCGRFALSWITPFKHVSTAPTPQNESLLDCASLSSDHPISLPPLVAKLEKKLLMLAVSNSCASPSLLTQSSQVSPHSSAESASVKAADLQLLNPTANSRSSPYNITVQHCRIFAWLPGHTLWKLPSPILTVPFQYPLLVTPPLPDLSTSDCSRDPVSVLHTSLCTHTLTYSCLVPRFKILSAH